VDLTDTAGVLRRGWWIVSLVIVMSVGVAIAVTELATKRYETSTRLLVSGSSAQGSSDGQARLALAERRASLIGRLASTGPVIAAAEQGSSSLANADPSISASGEGPVATIQVTADTPAAAKAVADAYPLVLPGELAKRGELPAASDQLVTVLEPASYPTHPSSPRPLRNILIGLALGVFLGLLAAGCQELFGRTLRNTRQVVRAAGAAILGAVPREFDAERLAAATRPHSRRAAAYVEVQESLESAVTGRALYSMLITSPGRGEGRSATAANLALVISRTGLRVAIIDADMGKPDLASIFNATTDTGLSDVLTGRATLAEVIQHVPGEQIALVAGGPGTAQSELLASPAMAEVLGKLVAQHDVVIVDGPPLASGAVPLVAQTDGTILVARERRTSRSSLRRAVAVVPGNGRLLGVVVNAVRGQAVPAPEVLSADAEQPPAAPIVEDVVLAEPGPAEEEPAKPTAEHPHEIPVVVADATDERQVGPEAIAAPEPVTPEPVKGRRRRAPAAQVPVASRVTWPEPQLSEHPEPTFPPPPRAAAKRRSSPIRAERFSNTELGRHRDAAADLDVSVDELMGDSSS
jgi:succinoglycan biosynthesis transport protein ExoP